jgi:hypothetical protein
LWNNWTTNLTFSRRRDPSVTSGWLHVMFNIWKRG